ncbi:energy transducer TonB [Providencia rettgeri]|nr:energy transducer TonB [Providencia rettgeri]
MVRIVNSSTHNTLDQAALSAVQKSRSVGAPPEGLKN